MIYQGSPDCKMAEQKLEWEFFSSPSLKKICFVPIIVNLVLDYGDSVDKEGKQQTKNMFDSFDRYKCKKRIDFPENL